MLGWAIAFFIIAVISAVFGFGNISEGATPIAQALCFIFLVVFVISIIAGVVRGRAISRGIQQ